LLSYDKRKHFPPPKIFQESFFHQKEIFENLQLPNNLSDKKSNNRSHFHFWQLRGIFNKIFQSCISKVVCKRFILYVKLIISDDRISLQESNNNFHFDDNQYK